MDSPTRLCNLWLKILSVYYKHSIAKKRLRCFLQVPTKQLNLLLLLVSVFNFHIKNTLQVSVYE